jgi:hypothetical protein
VASGEEESKVRRGTLGRRREEEERGRRGRELSLRFGAGVCVWAGGIRWTVGWWEGVFAKHLEGVLLKTTQLCTFLSCM